jgi:hypothetical protein
MMKKLSGKGGMKDLQSMMGQMGGNIPPGLMK